MASGEHAGSKEGPLGLLLNIAFAAGVLAMATEVVGNVLISSSGAKSGGHH